MEPKREQIGKVGIFIHLLVVDDDMWTSTRSIYYTNFACVLTYHFPLGRVAYLTKKIMGSIRSLIYDTVDFFKTLITCLIKNNNELSFIFF
jgi:hypothetical protein